MIAGLRDTYGLEHSPVLGGEIAQGADVKLHDARTLPWYATSMRCLSACDDAVLKVVLAEMDQDG